MANHRVVISKELILRNIKVTASGCWEWQGYILRIGYGQICSNFKRYQAHRVSKHLWHGFNLDSPKFICHSCDNRKCVNPDHLFEGTPEDNTRDAMLKGKLAHGERSGTAKLTATDVHEIRSLHSDGLTYQDLAEIYPVTKHNIQSVCSRKTWRHL